jgi:hypothetical protein
MSGEKMINRKLLFNLLGSGIVCLALAGIGSATVPRAFVSINGSDLNPCSAIQPCRSFNQALTVVQPGGEIVVQDSGGYSTGFTITQSVTIDAAGFNASVISTSATDLCTINAGPSDRVVLRGISFHGANVGHTAINATQVGSLYVERCSIAEFVAGGVSVLNGGSVFVTNTDVRACGTGLTAAATGATAANLVAVDSRFTECSAGVLLYVSSIAGAAGVVSNCTASICSFGFTVLSQTAATADLTLDNCRAVGNGVGLRADAFGTGGSATMRIYDCVVTQNFSGVSADSAGGGIPSVIGTNPGTSLISGNTNNNATTGSIDLE